MIPVTKTHRSEESAVDDLARSMLQLFEYNLHKLINICRNTMYDITINVQVIHMVVAMPLGTRTCDLNIKFTFFLKYIA